MHSLYNFCFYVSAKNNDAVLWQWRPYLHIDGDGLGLKDENGDYIEDTSQIEASALMIDDSNG
jgi:glucan biosynthesis protein